MIKCIALDMDGTLLNSKKQLPVDFLDVVQALSKKGIKFVIASGRQYAVLKEQLLPCDHLFSYLSDNGTLVYENDKCLFRDTIADNLVEKVLSIIPDMPYGICVSTQEGIYIKQKTYDMYHESYKHYYRNQIIIDDYNKIKNIVKFALYDPNHCFDKIYLLDDLKLELSIFSSGPDWYDIQNYGVSKGASLEKLANNYGFLPEEILAFGDAMNDYEMIKFAGHGVAMANADDRVKAVAKHLTTSNDEDGVMIILRQLLKNDCKM